MRGYALGLFAALISQGAAAEWTVNGKDPAAVVIEGVSVDGGAALRITCRRAAMEMSFIFANGMKPSHLRYQIDDKSPNLQAAGSPGPGFTLTKPYSYATLVGLIRGSRVAIEGVNMGQGDSAGAVFDLTGLESALDPYRDLCLFASPHPRA